AVCRAPAAERWREHRRSRWPRALRTRPRPAGGTSPAARRTPRTPAGRRARARGPPDLRARAGAAGPSAATCLQQGRANPSKDPFAEQAPPARARPFDLRRAGEACERGRRHLRRTAPDGHDAPERPFLDAGSDLLYHSLDRMLWVALQSQPNGRAGPDELD